MWCVQSELASFFSVSPKRTYGPSPKRTYGPAEVLSEQGDDDKKKKIRTLSQTRWNER